MSQNDEDPRSIQKKKKILREGFLGCRRQKEQEGQESESIPAWGGMCLRDPSLHKPKKKCTEWTRGQETAVLG